MRLLFIIISLSLLTQCAKKRHKIGLWQTEIVEPLPMATSNQAVSEGYIDSEPYLYTFGGLDSTKTYAGIHQRSFRMNIQQGTWEAIPSLPDTLGKIANAASRIDDIIYIIGGYHVMKDGSEKSSNRVHRFHTPTNTFISDAEPLPVPIDDHVQVVWRNKLIYVISGWSDSQNVNAVQIFDPQKNKWMFGTPVPDNNDFMSFGASGTIVGDTIYYFGGASMGENFPIQSQLRKGVINSNDPQQITWTLERTGQNLTGYRMASFNFRGKAYWAGGSSHTYNYNAMAYKDSTGVEPNQRLLSYDHNSFNKTFLQNIPMDLRGIANINDSIKYLIGGISENQKVSNQVIKLSWHSTD